MDDLLGNSPDVMEWRVESLLGEDQHEPLPHLELAQRGDCQIYKEAVENWDGNLVEWLWNHQHRNSNQYMREEESEPRFPDIDDILCEMTVLYVFFNISQSSNMEGRVG